MDTLLRIGLSNAAVAIVLAVLAVAAGCLGRRPALAHGLWLLVLLKLVTPPLVPIALPWPAAPETAEAATPPEMVAILPPPAEGPLAEEGPAPEVVGVNLEPGPAPAIPDAASPAPPTAADDAPSWSWASVAVGVWLFGSASWFTLASLRLNRFRHLLRHARPASAELQEEARRLARQMGLPRCPGVWLLPGQLAPMLWSARGAPRLLLPAG